MRRAILVDDEVFARKGLVGLIPWEQYGFEIIAEAEDGEEALALIEQHKPDLVITDIRMPVLDGLELIQTVQERLGKAVKFIIISGYGDFKYAQQAVRFGVHDYLLKPIDEDELMETLQRIAAMLDSTPSWTQEGNPMLQASLFEQLISGKADDKTLSEAAQYLALQGDKPLRYIALELNDIAADSTDEQRNSQIEMVRETIVELLKRRLEITPVVYVRSQSELGIILRPDVNPAWTVRLGEELVRAAKGQIMEGTVPLVYVGATAESLREVKQSYQSAMELMRLKYAFANQSVIVFDDLGGMKLQFKELEPSFYSELMERLEEHDNGGVNLLADAMFRAFQEQRFALESMTSSLARCVHEATRIIQTMQGDESKLTNLQPILQWHNEPRTLQGVKQLLTQFLSECMTSIASLRSTTMRGDIGKIRSYIETNYTSNISLKSIAKLFYMNPVYLGQLFKKTYGVYFNDFLLQIRIQEAKRQLRQTDKKIYEIAASVGFGNPDYFVSQFEKVEGKTPTEYKNAMIAKK
ncbi:response regulator transcription factor [Paenibacillus sp. OV219]|uniref:response regulator transcription factor n=1 Tax=Paenibacillus sp. OV219 TaxID=1884377 RepID=UPI0008C4F06A|nr:response regulator transcription factor [Paenibacillus sp. OV219]SEO48845.1 two-component system, response regulator YesN [Paenibacillus sp. OV219]